MVSVCMAVYNGEKFLKDQIASILLQLSADDELIISDDGPTDSTSTIVKSFADNRIKYFINTDWHGVNGNFQNALNHAKGDYIFLSDQDDVWLDGKVEACVAALADSYCVVHDCMVTDGDLKVTDDSFFKTRNSRSGFFHNWIRNGYLGCAMAFRREALDLCLPIPKGLPIWHDIWIGALCELKYGVKFIPFKGIYFRRHDSNTSVTAKSTFKLSHQIAYRLKELPYIFGRYFGLL